MKSATSLLLGAALATAFFLLYTSVRRDLDDGPARSPPPRWTQEKREDSVREATGRPNNQEAVVKVEEEKKDDDGGGRDGSSSDKQKQQHIVMPAEQQQVCLRLLTRK
jgi:hypothetical protein